MPLPAWVIAVIVNVALSLLAMVITPRPKGPKPEAAQQADNPTAEAGVPIFWLRGSARVSAPNVLGFWDKATRQYQIKVN